MDIRQLKYYSAIFEHKNLSHAATYCGVAQSAISHHLSNLEAELGVTLFQRKPRGMEPTAAGIKLYEHARSILKAMEAARQDIRTDSEMLAGDIAVGLPHTVMKAIGLPFMHAVLKDYPEVRLSIVESFSAGTFANLLSSDVDISLFYNPQKDERITQKIVLEEEVMCVGKSSIIGKEHDEISIEKFATLPALLLREGVSARAVIDRPSLINKLDAKVPLQLNSINGIMMGLLAGLGCTLAPQVFVAEHLKSGALHARPIAISSLTRHLYIGHLKDRPSTRLTEAMSSLVLNLISAEVKNGNWNAQLR